MIRLQVQLKLYLQILQLICALLLLSYGDYESLSVLVVSGDVVGEQTAVAVKDRKCKICNSSTDRFWEMKLAAAVCS